MGVWELKYYDEQVKKYLKLSLDQSFSEKQRAKFGAIAIEAMGKLGRLKAKWTDAALTQPLTTIIPKRTKGNHRQVPP